jgi:hypothetical protein
MATWRLSRLQQRILHWLAVDHQRTKGMIVSSHEDLIKALREDKSGFDHSVGHLSANDFKTEAYPIVKTKKSDN